MAKYKIVPEDQGWALYMREAFIWWRVGWSSTQESTLHLMDRYVGAYSRYYDRNGKLI